MKVCIGVTSKNRVEILPKTIQSAIDQDYDQKEIVIFNDGSDDGTADLQSVFPNVTWKSVKDSIGVLEARNRLMRETDADLYVSLDDDAWFLQNDEISIAVSYFKSDPTLGAIAFDVLQRNTSRFEPVPRAEPVETNIFIGCGHILLLKAADEAGYYVPFPVKYGHEEKDLTIRMLNKGYSLLFLPGVHVWHDHTDLARDRKDQSRSFLINNLVYLYRRAPSLYLVPILGYNILRKIRSRDYSKRETLFSIWRFLRFIPSQRKLISRVSRKSYRNYRRISKSYLGYLDDNDQSKL